MNRIHGFIFNVVGMLKKHLLPVWALFQATLCQKRQALVGVVYFKLPVPEFLFCRCVQFWQSISQSLSTTE